MKKMTVLLFLALAFSACGEKLQSEVKTFEKKSALPCQDICPKAVVKVPVFTSGQAADSINAKLFSVMKEIVYFGEQPYDATDYQGLVDSFIVSYEKIKREDPEEKFGCEAEVTGRVNYRSEKLLGITLDHYTFTGGAHGYGGKRSLFFDPKTGKCIANNELFRDVDALRTLAESRFRQKYKIADSAPINSGGLMFENDAFTLPETIFLTDKGLLLYYNTYEIASYAEGPQELLLPYADVDAFLKYK